MKDKKNPAVHKNQEIHKENHAIKHESITCKNKCNLKEYVWQITSLVLLVLLIIVSIFAFSGNTTKVEDNSSLVGQETRDYLIEKFSLPELILKSTVYENNMYLHTFQIEGNDFNIHTSLDGEIIFVPGIEPLYKSIDVVEDIIPQDNQQEQVNLEKTEKPVVELFIMSHCPFGTQIEKGILPVVDLLGDTINFEVKFVNYAMHDLVEVEEQLLQYCIQENSKELYKEYLYCFLEDGNTNRCLEKIGISREELSGCIQETDQEYSVMASYEDKSSWLNGRFPKFLIHQEDNLKYDVKGSPTLVINGTVVNSARDPQSLLNSICNGFQTQPRDCNTELSTENPQPGFGFKTTTNTNTATCG